MICCRKQTWTLSWFVRRLVHTRRLSWRLSERVPYRSAIVDLARSKMTTIAERYEIPSVALTLHDLLSETDLDAVLVCSPTGTHEAIVMEALGAGLHVLCERPLCPTVEAADRLIETAASADRQLMVAMNHRYSFDLRSIQQFVASGELGEPFFVHTAWHNHRQRRPRRGWRRDASLPGARARAQPPRTC